jgi:hypothetical protein
MMMDQLVFSAGTVFFLSQQIANNVFQPAYQPSRTGPYSILFKPNRKKDGE